ncbi:MAG: TonB-dependent receptor plug domain-containing protein [Kiritimatiellae bacterium]|nr:TonB-dependent receptor plug domain-containing protein [Kiritimatiellia bacterium]
MKRIASAAFAVCAAGVSPAATNVIAELEPVAVYASRIDDAKEAMAAPVQVYDAGAIAASGARDLPELLEKTAGIDVHRLNANPMQSEISMRGFGENSFGRVKVVLDGEELGNVDMFAPNLMRAPLGSVERIEVVRGPSPVLHGDGAVAGVVNAVTVPDGYEERYRIAGKAGSQNTFGAGFSAKGGVAGEGVQYHGAYDYLRSDGWRRRSAYELHSANAGLRKNFENGSRVGVKANYQNAFYELPGALPLAGWKDSRRRALNPDDWCRTWAYGIGLDSKMRLGEGRWLYADGGFSHQRRDANWGGYGYKNRYELFGFRFSPRYVDENDLFGFGSKFTAGLDFGYDRDTVHDRSGFNASRYHFARSRYALYVYEEFFLSETLSAVFGARLENICNRWNGYRGLDRTESSDWAGDFELGLVWRPADGVKTYAKGTRFHRSAFCDEMNYTKDGRLLDPERGMSLDIGLEWEFLEEFEFDANGYGMLIDDEIFYNPYASASPWGWNGYNCNSPARTRRAGLDAGISWRRDKVAEASVRYGAVYADFASGQYKGCDVPRVPNNRVRAEAGVWILDDLEIKGGCRFVDRQRLVGDFGNAHDRLPGYTVFDVGAYWTPSWAKGWKASFVMDNLLDRKYCDFAGWSDYSGGYCYPACGRSFMFTLSYEF